MPMANDAAGGKFTTSTRSPTMGSSVMFSHTEVAVSPSAVTVSVPVARSMAVTVAMRAVGTGVALMASVMAVWAMVAKNGASWSSSAWVAGSSTASGAVVVSATTGAASGSEAGLAGSATTGGMSLTGTPAVLCVPSARRAPASASSWSRCTSGPGS